ncbi:MAG: ATP-dependent sacrificial sulfur transferase LarE [Eubacterium sp.]|nr:ATP-dependent sacrificial sulfur transferase LarE [Eubacterium sp.]
MNLTQFFKENPKAAIAFSGGVDSSYLLYAALSAGADVTAYYVKSAFQPAFELEDAKRLAAQLHADMRILEADILSCAEVTANPPNRCYFCKKQIFSAIAARAEEDGHTLILDGTNASDDAGDRPGMKALAELSVRSPLRECGLTKTEIRRLSKDAGLFTWDKPAYACLATRIPSGTVITAELLEKTEKAESFLTDMGFTDFRVRLADGAAKLQVPAGQMEKVMKNRESILNELKKYYSAVTLDLEARDA